MITDTERYIEARKALNNIAQQFNKMVDEIRHSRHLKAFVEAEEVEKTKVSERKSDCREFIRNL